MAIYIWPYMVIHGKIQPYTAKCLVLYGHIWASWPISWRQRHPKWHAHGAFERQISKVFCTINKNHKTALKSTSAHDTEPLWAQILALTAAEMTPWPQNCGETMRIPCADWARRRPAHEPKTGLSGAAGVMGAHIWPYVSPYMCPYMPFMVVYVAIYDHLCPHMATYGHT